MFFKVAFENNAVLVSLDKEDFIEKVKNKNPDVEAYDVSEFPH